MKLNWGVLSTAKIAVEKVIPSMAAGTGHQVTAIASRSSEKAKEVADKLGIPKSYGSYEELIADPDVHVIYNPLPNHLHADYTIRCIEAGKHVLCEKPIALTEEDVLRIIKARNNYGVKVGEAFMVKTHPQWLKARELVQSGALGRLKMVQGAFSFNNTDPENIRNIPEYGGGAVWDIGCYPVTTARFVLGEEPLKLVSQIAFDPEFGTDVLVSVIMQFPSAQVSFSVSTQMVPHQRMRFFGDQKELEIMIPFNAPADRACRLKLFSGDIFQEKVENLSVEECNQYSIMTEAFSKAIKENTRVPVTLEDGLANTRVLEAIYLSAREGRWVELNT